MGSTMNADDAARRTALRMLRPQRIGTASICASALVLGGGATLVIAVLGVVDPDHPLVRGFSDVVTGSSALGSAAPASAAVAAVVAGAALITWAVVPGSRGPVALRTDDPSIVLGLTRRGAARLLTEEVLGVDGVSDARVRVGRRRVRIRVSTHLRGDGGPLRERVEASVRGRCEGLGVLTPPRVSTRVREVGST
ncbi:DUF6286 domain-containing protein [Nocardiopsis sp. N85]|uniref:DUF6286 domain-containing protein n=1 Tax=Nocardiopsis sp. N85 TaxID=3029400 RepID=UPI00237FB3FD|nr:DUF6286 domain-containing protein [Nocardiopsis sp. N85]MDE3723501.1 DUF6286 domain-containing protein [Nocardiopsis sp. N85]